MCPQTQLYVGTCVISHVPFFATLWTVARQAPLSVGLSRQEYWSGVLPFPSPGHRPDPGIEPESLMSPALPGGCFITGTILDSQLSSNFMWRKAKTPTYLWSCARPPKFRGGRMSPGEQRG